MANPTTNYGFVMPTNTDLVKDLPADFDVFGQAVDTKIKDLNPETTAGDISYRGSTANAKTRLGIGTARQVLAVNAGATAPEWIASSTSTLTTTGDLLYASAANTLARRAIGSTGDVLTVSGGLPTWAAPASGGITQIASTTASTNTVTFSSISGTYQHLMLLISNYRPVNSGDNLRMRFNSSATGYINNDTYGARADVAATETEIEFTNNVGNASGNGAIYIFIPNYSSSTAPKITNGYGFFQSNITVSRFSMRTITGFWNNTAAITSLGFTAGGNNITSGVFTLYGVK